MDQWVPLGIDPVYRTKAYFTASRRWLLVHGWVRIDRLMGTARYRSRVQNKRLHYSKLLLPLRAWLGAYRYTLGYRSVTLRLYFIVGRGFTPAAGNCTNFRIFEGK